MSVMWQFFQTFAAPLSLLVLEIVCGFAVFADFSDGFSFFAEISCGFSVSKLAAVYAGN